MSGQVMKASEFPVQYFSVIKTCCVVEKVFLNYYMAYIM